MRRQIGLYGTIVYALMVWTIFQEFVLGILYHYIHVEILIKVLFFSKDILLVILYVTALFKTKLPRRFAILQICYLPFVFVGVGTSIITKQVSITTMLSAARGLILLPAFMTIGYSVVRNETFLSIIKKKYMNLLVLVAAVGIVDYLLDITLGTKRFWTDFVQLGSYMRDIKDAANVLYGDLPGNFYTYSAMGYFTQKRLVSFWAHPLTSGYCLVIPFVYYFNVCFLEGKTEKDNIINKGKLLIVSIALFLTFTRATILPSLAFTILCLLYKYRKDGGKLLLAVIAFLSIFLIGLIVFREKIFGYVYNGSTSAHIASVSSAIKEVGVLGKGAGTFAAATTEGIWTESAYISIAGQLGIIAAFFYLLLFLLPIYYAFRRNRKTNLFVSSIAISGIIFFITGFISEQISAYTTIAPYFILSGAVLNYSFKKSYVMHQANYTITIK